MYTRYIKRVRKTRIPIDYFCPNIKIYYLCTNIGLLLRGVRRVLKISNVDIKADFKADEAKV